MHELIADLDGVMLTDHDEATHPHVSEHEAAERQAMNCVDEDSLKLWWHHAQRYPLLSASDEVELAVRIEAGDQAAFDEMVEANLRLVGHIARRCRRYAGTSLSLADLIQEGSVGLMRAVRKFDHRKGYKFSTYASYWIRQAVMRSIAESGRSIRLPVYVIESASRADRARAVLTQQFHRPPTRQEVADHLEVCETKIHDLGERMLEPVSLDTVVGSDEELPLIDYVQDMRAESPADLSARGALREELETALAQLSQREMAVLCMRYGFNDSGESRTLDQIGAELQLTRERIRQIETHALKRLKGFCQLQETAQINMMRHSVPPPSGITSIA